MITILKNGVEFKFKQFMFPAGEVGVKLDVENYKYQFPKFPNLRPQIIARLQNPIDVMELAMVNDALKRLRPKAEIDLILPYVPYGRQDRVCVLGESFSLLVFAKLIKAMDFDSVTIFDPHSEVTPATFEAVGINVKVISQFAIIQRFDAFANRVTKGTIFVSPDAGANKKTMELANYFDHTEFIRADKLRNLATGEIKETVVLTDDIKGQDVVIADDICDGGRTFVELAKALKTKNAGKIILYITHGIFSKGIGALSGIDEIFITNSWGGITQAKLRANVTTFELECMFLP